MTTPSKNVIARQIAMSFGLVAAVAALMCGMLFSGIARVSGLVMMMRRDEHAIDDSHRLATAVREQYMHQAHTLIERSRAHLGHYEEWVSSVGATSRGLEPLVPASERGRLERVIEQSTRLDAMFREQILPAAERGDDAEVVRLHHEADHLSSAAAKEADAIARSVEQRMVQAHVSATEAIELALVGGGGCLLLVLALSLGSTMRLRKAVLNPLAALADAARRFGAGDYSARLGAFGQGELRAVAAAFDHMADAIEARERRMLEAERMAVVGQLAAGVAHEINNPIGVIRGYLKTMTPGSAPEVLQEELRILDEEAAACQRIAEDLLSYAKGADLRRVQTQMKEFLEEVTRRIDDTGGQSGRRFVVNAQRGSILLDPARVRQLLYNLLRNAANAAPGGSPIEVVGTMLREGGYEVTVADRGPGVDRLDRARIFEPFFSKVPGGSGLGLAVCESIVRAHGGTIAVEDNPGGGALFRVRFPEASSESPR